MRGILGTARADMLGVALAMALAGCTESELNVLITNDDAALASRVHATDVPVPGTRLALTLVAEADAPTLDGNVLQATSVVLVGDTAVVTYNTRGDARYGGMETYRIDRTGDGPEITLTSQAIFPETEIHSASFDGDDTLVCAGATNDPTFLAPSLLDAMGYVDGDMTEGARYGLDSYAATGSVSVPGAVLATTGDDGSLVVLDPDTFELLDSVPLDDARWVDATEDTVAVVQGMPGRLALFSLEGGTLTERDTVPFAGADVPASKSTVVLAGRRAFVAAGTAGTQVIDLSTGAPETEIPLPELDIPAEFLVTNAAAVDCNYAFLSDGGGGVWVAGLHGSWDPDTSAPNDKPPAVDCPQGGKVGNIAVEFDCDRVLVSSCKDLSNVVIKLDDGREIKYDGLNDPTGIFSSPDGETIVTAWIKAGNNHSGDGPGYGQRFEAPAQSCDDAPPPPPGSCAVDADHLGVELMGGLEFDGPVSVNHVAWDGEYLFLAAGLGGLKVVRLDEAE